MPFSSGVFTFTSTTFAPTPTTNTVISSTAAATTWADIATALSTAVLKDGTQTLTANIPMSSFKLTGLGAGSTTGDSLRYEQLFSGSNLAIAATQAQQETGTTTAAAVTPARQQSHQSALKGWANAKFDGTVNASYNVTSVTDNGAGDISVNWAVDFTDTTYGCNTTAQIDAAGTAASTFTTQVMDTDLAAGVTRARSIRMSDFAAIDATNIRFAAYGDQP